MDQKKATRGSSSKQNTFARGSNKLDDGHKNSPQRNVGKLQQNQQTSQTVDKKNNLQSQRGKNKNLKNGNKRSNKRDQSTRQHQSRSRKRSKDNKVQTSLKSIEKDDSLSKASKGGPVPTDQFEIIPQSLGTSKMILDSNDIHLAKVRNGSLQIELRNPTDETASHVLVQETFQNTKLSSEKDHHSLKMGEITLPYAHKIADGMNYARYQNLDRQIVDIYSQKPLYLPTSVTVSQNNSQIDHVQQTQHSQQIQSTIQYKKGSSSSQNFDPLDSQRIGSSEMGFRSKFPEIIDKGFSVIKDTGRYTNQLQDKKLNRAKIQEKKKTIELSEMVIKKLQSIIIQDLVDFTSYEINQKIDGTSFSQQNTSKNRNQSTHVTTQWVRAREEPDGVEIIEQTSQGPSSMNSNQIQSNDQPFHFQTKDSPGRIKCKKMVQINIQQSSPNDSQAEYTEVYNSKNKKIQRFLTLKDQQKAGNPGFKGGNNGINLTNQNRNPQVDNDVNRKQMKRGRTQMADGQDDNNQTLFKISESGLEELSIVESEDLYNSEYDNDDARRRYDETLQHKIREAAKFKRSGTEDKKSWRQGSHNKQFTISKRKDRSESPVNNQNHHPHRPMIKNSDITKARVNQYRHIEQFSIQGSSEAGYQDSHFNQNYRKSRERITNNSLEKTSIISSIENYSLNQSNQKSQRSHLGNSQRKVRNISTKDARQNDSSPNQPRSYARQSEQTPENSDFNSNGFNDGNSSEERIQQAIRESPLRLGIQQPRKGIIPKIPGFKKNKRHISKNFQRALSKELDRVPEKDEPDYSPSKAEIHHIGSGSFGGAIQIQTHSIESDEIKPPLQQVADHTTVHHLIERKGEILIVNTQRQEKAKGGSKQVDYTAHRVDTVNRTESPAINVTDHDELTSHQLDNSTHCQYPATIPGSAIQPNSSNTILNLKIQVSDRNNEVDQPQDQRLPAEGLADSRRSLIKSSLKSLNHRSSNENFANIKNQGLFIPNQESVSQVKGKSRLYLEKISTKENQKQNEIKHRSAYVNQTNMKVKQKNSQSVNYGALNKKSSPGRVIKSNFAIKTHIVGVGSPEKQGKFSNFKADQDNAIRVQQESEMLQRDQIYNQEGYQHQKNASDIIVPSQKNKLPYASPVYTIKKQKTLTQKTTYGDLNVWRDADSKENLNHDSQHLKTHSPGKKYKRQFQDESQRLAPKLKSNETARQSPWQNQGAQKQNKVFVDSIESLEADQQGVIKRYQYARRTQQVSRRAQKRAEPVQLPQVQGQMSTGLWMSDQVRAQQSRGKGGGSGLGSMSSGQKLEYINKTLKQDANYYPIAQRGRAETNVEKNLKLKNEVMFQMIKNIYQQGTAYAQAQTKTQPPIVVQNFHFNSFYTLNNSQVGSAGLGSSQGKRAHMPQPPNIVSSSPQYEQTSPESESISGCSPIPLPKKSAAAPRTQQNFSNEANTPVQPYGLPGKNKMLNQILTTSVPLGEQRQVIKKPPRELSSLNSNIRNIPQTAHELRPTKISYRQGSSMAAETAGVRHEGSKNSKSQLQREEPFPQVTARGATALQSRRLDKDDVYKKYKRNAKSIQKQIKDLAIGSKGTARGNQKDNFSQEQVNLHFSNVKMDIINQNSAKDDLNNKATTHFSFRNLI